MRWSTAAAAALVASMLAMTSTPALAGNPQSDLRPLLLETLQGIQRGSCSPRLAPLVAGTCIQQIGLLASRLNYLGPVLGMMPLGYQMTPQGPAQVYLVQFQNGQMTWMIGLDSTGQISVFWTPG